MTTCTPFSWLHRLGIAVVSGALSLTILASLLLLFNDGRMPGKQISVAAVLSTR